MAHFILVHGAWHGAWCWYRLVPELERRGHRAVAIDLPGLGDDTTPAETVTLDAYADRIGDALRSCAEPCVLVGHSMGGIPISLVAERQPEQVRALVYVAAFIPADGQSLSDIEADNPDPRVPQAMVPAADGRTAMIRLDSVRELFYQDCGEDDIALAQARLRPQAMAPIFTRLHLTRERYGCVPRTYIECIEDGAISCALQRRMQQAWPGTAVLALRASHSPFFSMPAQLADLLSRAANP